MHNNSITEFLKYTNAVTGTTLNMDNMNGVAMKMKFFILRLGKFQLKFNPFPEIFK